MVGADSRRRLLQPGAWSSYTVGAQHRSATQQTRSASSGVQRRGVLLRCGITWGRGRWNPMTRAPAKCGGVKPTESWANANRGGRNWREGVAGLHARNVVEGVQLNTLGALAPECNATSRCAAPECNTTDSERSSGVQRRGVLLCRGINRGMCGVYKAKDCRAVSSVKHATSQS